MKKKIFRNKVTPQNNTISRIFFLVLFLTNITFGFSQELNIGGFVTTNWIIDNNSEILGFGANIEYKPNKIRVSINSDISIFWVEKGPIATLPLSLKIIIGNRLRVCPTFGGFVRTNENYGYSAGIIIDYKITNQIIVYLKNEYMRDYWKWKNEYWYKNNYVGKRISQTSAYSIWLNIGLKFNLLSPKSKDVNNPD